MWRGTKELGVTVKVELRSHKGEQAATHIHILSLDYSMLLPASFVNQ